jgi:hypothetical protein
VRNKIRNRSIKKIPERRQPNTSAPLDDYVITLIDFGLSKKHQDKKQARGESGHEVRSGRQNAKR